MAYVSVPKDLSKVKNKVVFNLTKRQLLCIGVGALMGIPFYFLTRNALGTSTAATGMVILMLPAFLMAMYEKDGMHLENILWNMIRVKMLRPAVRKYETRNLYETNRVAPGREMEDILGKKQSLQKNAPKKGKKRKKASQRRS